MVLERETGAGYQSYIVPTEYIPRTGHMRSDLQVAVTVLRVVSKR
jgi:hypothetical protein